MSKDAPAGTAQCDFLVKRSGGSARRALEHWRLWLWTPYNDRIKHHQTFYTRVRLIRWKVVLDIFVYATTPCLLNPMSQPNPRHAVPCVIRGALLLTLLAAALLTLAACSKTQLQQPGTKAAAVTLQDQDGVERPLSSFEGAPLLVYFYPKNDTPGCTTEACALRDSWDRYKSAGIQIVGVSTDSVESHAKFAQKHELPFVLLSDSDAKMAKAFGVSKRLGFLARVSFLLDDAGVIRAVYPDVDPALHANEVLESAQELGLSTPDTL